MDKYIKINLFIILFIMIMSGGYPFMAPQTSYFIHESKKEFSKYEMNQVVFNKDSSQLELAKTNNQKYFSEGILTSPVCKSKFPFEALVISWNGTFPEGTYLICEAQIKGRSPFWSPWHEILRYGKDSAVTKGKYKDSWAAKVDSDQLKLKVQGREFRYRFKLISKKADKTPSIRLICVSYANYRDQKEQPDLLMPNQNSSGTKAEWIKDLNVPFRSQLVEDKEISWRACHPTSLSMVLQYHGKNLPTSEVAWKVWDPYNEIFGNWVYNAAFAGEMGYRSYVRYCSTFDPIKEQIAKGNPAIISIKFSNGELKNSPMNGTKGHIIVVRGFTENGDPVCNDPATRKEETGHVVYKKEELEKAWITHSGAAVMIEPRG